MPSITVSPRSIVNQIKNLLRDRYASGYPILKELVQNADDAEARRVRLETLAGWPGADNPLLRGPGLLAVNDGTFRREDRHGVLSFGESVKATDGSVIGKFGLGQKAVFHLCDAFVVHAFGSDGSKESHEPCSDVVNPFLGVEVDGNKADTWERLSGRDLSLLRAAVPADCRTRALLLWLPFRRDGLQPAPDAGFSTVQPQPERVVAELARRHDLRLLVTALRHVESIEIRDRGELRCAAHLVAANERLLGPDRWPAGVRSFRGTVETKLDGTRARFVGREANLRTERLQILQGNEHWPPVISALSSTSEPEKGEPHGAATLLRVVPTAKSQSADDLTISWAVFLPISETEPESTRPAAHASETMDSMPRIRLTGYDSGSGAAGLGQFHLLLHGYFFLDSGRRHIEGLSQPTASENPSTTTELGRAWNAELRDSVVLPLIPAVLWDALEQKLITSAELAAVAANVTRHAWFSRHQRFICGEHALVRGIEAPNTVVWRLVPAGSSFRPLPRSVADAPERLRELFSGVHALARDRDLVLCVDPDASLTAEPPRWLPDEVDDLFSTLSPRAFQSPALARLLSAVLDVADPPLGSNRSVLQETIGLHVRRALRDALNDTDSPLAHSEQVRSVLSHAPRNLFLSLPKSVEHRRLLQALALAPTAVLPVRHEWLVDAGEPRLRQASDHPPLSRTDLAAMLGALEPIIAGRELPDLADQAATAALEFLRDQNLSELSGLDDFADLAILRGQDPGTDEQVVLTLKESCACSRKELLFRTTPTAKVILRKLARALPDAHPVIVSGKTAELLGEQGGSALRLLTADKRACLDLVDAASGFGSDTHRAELIDALQVASGNDRTALRKLCAGKSEAGMLAARLAATDGLSSPMESIATRCVADDESLFLVPRRIADALSQNQRDYIGVGTLDNRGIEALLTRNANTLLDPRLTETERDAILETDISDSAVKALPIHVRSDGTVGNTEGVFLETEAWAIPRALKEQVQTAVLSSHPRARKRQVDLMPRWSPRVQIDTALSRPAPHTLQNEILDALARISHGSDAGDDPLHLGTSDHELRTTSWLAVGENPTAPGDVWTLSQPVEDAARSLFSSIGQQTRFFTVDRLPFDVREHPGFRYVEEHLLQSSLEALAEIVAAADVPGHLGPVENCPVDDLVVLAESSNDLVLPGWRLLAALLLSARDTDRDVATFCTSFRQLSECDHDLAGRYLDALAELASRKDPTGEAAQRAYEHGFKAVAKWSDEARCRVFRRTRVPTVGGQWRSGREVVLEPDLGVAPTHVLARTCAATFRMHDDHDVPGGNMLKSAGDGPAPPDRALAPDAAVSRGNDSAVSSVDLPAIEAESVDRHRRFLEPWRGRVPSDLVIVYLGFVGRFGGMRRYAEEWEGDATHDVGTLWRELDERLDPLLPEPLCGRVNHRRFRVTEVRGSHVPAVALSGEPFEAPLDDTLGLLVSNFHKRRNVITSGADSQRRLLVELHLRPVEPAAGSQAESLRIFRHFVETVAVDCLWIGMTDERAALSDILDKASLVDQTTLEETQRLLRDLLPGVLAQLKPTRGSACQQALQKYQDEESWIHRVYGASDPSGPAELANSKMALWRRLHGEAAGAELLSAVRAKIEDLGYSARSVLFELFQNADDAYVQLDDAPNDPCFQVEILPDAPSGFRVVHWGRPINHRGPNVEVGGRCRYDRDLVNMLLMNFSEKRPRLTEEDLTGKFGLGFKSVHILSDSVGIASGFVALRTHGGFLAVEWPVGSREANNRNRPDGPKATVVDVPFAADRTAQGQECIRGFRAALTWLPVFARRIRRVAVTGMSPVTVECSSTTLVGADGIDVVTVDASAESSRALRFDLGDGYSLLLRVDGVGPCATSNDTPRIWNLGPLDERVTSGWLLNGPFPVDPGRGRLAGSSEDHRSLFGRLGRSLGARLLELHDVAANDWARFARAVGLDPSEHAAQPRLWSRLFGVLRRDLDDSLARCLHAEGGYRRLAGERPVVPTGLPQPFDELVCATEVTRRTSGALTDTGVFKKVRDWPVLSVLRRRVVNTEATEVLRQLGFDGIRPITLCGLLGDEMGADKRIDPERGKRIGEVITPSEIEKKPLDQERDSILDVAKHVEFRAQDESWRPVGALNSQLAGREDEKRLCEFAPDSTLLHRDYQGAAIEFFKVARNRAGYGPQVRHLLEWARRAGDLDRQRAVLRYLVEGHQGPRLADALRHNRPAWMPEDARNIPPDLLPTERPDESRKTLVIRLGGHEQVEVREPAPPEPLPPSAESVLLQLHDWWTRVGPSERKEYDRRVYPSGFLPTQLQQEDDRAGWFTMFALACFRSLGWFRDGQHRGFMTLGRNEGWWQQLAESTPPRPPDEVQPWIDLLERWSAPTQFGQDFLPWRRTFGELYTFVRWLDAYILLFRRLPSVIRTEGPVSMDDILRPAYSPAFRPLGLEAAPLDSSLRIGVSWLLRELSHHGVYDAGDAELMAPYCWAPTQGVQEYLQELGANCNDSRSIHDFVKAQIGDERARFAGDFDLPLQLRASSRGRSPS